MAAAGAGEVGGGGGAIGAIIALADGFGTADRLAEGAVEPEGAGRTLRVKFYSRR